MQTNQSIPKMGGAVGAGIVLVLIPSLLLVFANGQLAAFPDIGLPTLAIFGIMILLGALALVSTLFARLNLSAPTEALALPPGSVRAAIALALIVLFALTAVMLHHSLTQFGHQVSGLNESTKENVIKQQANHVQAVIPVCTPASVPSGNEACKEGVLTYTIIFAPDTASIDFAKQLMTLIGTLMTSVVSFYFAARSTEAVTKTMGTLTSRPASQSGSANSETLTPVNSDDADHSHGDVQNVTRDEDLPPSQGGVAS